MKTFRILSMMAITGALFMACENTEMETVETMLAEKSVALDGVCPNDSAFITTADDLTEADIAGLMLMREEEKMAHDVYSFFYGAYSLTIFERIARSEQRHSEAVLALINHYGLTDPAGIEPGVFSDPGLQELYDVLIINGSDSLEALKVGALIEETDIADLLELIEATENPDIERVYGHLLRGSYQHLKGFVKVLEREGFTYTPQILSEDVFAEILAKPNGNHGGKGQGINQANQGQNGKNRKGKGQNGNGNRGENGGQANAGKGGSNGQGSGDGTGSCGNG